MPGSTKKRSAKKGSGKKRSAKKGSGKKKSSQKKPTPHAFRAWHDFLCKWRDTHGGKWFDLVKDPKVKAAFHKQYNPEKPNGRKKACKGGE